MRVALGMLLLAAIAVTLLHRLSLRHGVYAPPDSWAYWEGSVSILQTGHYRFVDGPPIRDWPPGYSLYLALAQAFLGVSGASLITATSLLVGLAFLGWSALALQLSTRNESASGSALVPFFLAAVFTGAFLLSAEGSVLAHSLQLAMLPWVLLVGGEVRGFGKVVVVSALGLGVLLLTHNTSLAFIPALAAFHYVRLGKKGMTATFVGAGLAVVAWFLSQMWLGQTGIHAVGLGLARHSPGVYLLQLARGLGAFVLPAAAASFDTVAGMMGLVTIGLGFVATCRLARGQLSSSAEVASASLFAFAAVALIGLFSLFNLTWVNDGLADRFLWFAPLATAIAALVECHRRHRLAAWALCLLLSAVPAGRAAKYVARSVVAPVLPVSDERFGIIIEPDFVIGKVPPDENLRRVQPPRFLWQTWHHRPTVE